MKKVLDIDGLEYLWGKIEEKVSEATPINNVTASVDANTGTPSVTPTYNNGTLNFAFQNIKGEQGLKGDTVILGDEEEYTLYTDRGNSTTGAMTQDAVTTEFVAIDNKVDGYDETQETTEEKTISNVGKAYNTSLATVGSKWSSGSSGTSSTGYACTRVAVTAGETYRIYGRNGGTKATKQYFTTDSSLIVLYVSQQSAVNSRENPTVVNITTNGYLYINFNAYDSTLDKVVKVGQVTIHHDGLTEIAEDHENRIATLEGATEVEVEDSLTSDDATAALSAKQGKVLNIKIEGEMTDTETPKSLTTGKYYNTTNATVGNTWDYGTSSTSGVACKAQSVTTGQKYRIYGYAGGGAGCQYVLLDSDKVVLYKKTGEVNSRTTPTEITIENNGYLIVNFGFFNSETDKLVSVTSAMAGGVEQEIDAIETRLTSLEAAGKPLTGKTIVCFGDSLTQLQGDVQNKRWTDFFQEITGATVINVGIGGARFCQRRIDSSIITNPSAEGYTNTMNIFSALDVVNMVRAACDMRFNENYSYLELAQQFVTSTGDAGKVAAVERLSNIDWSNVDAVFIMAGANDWNNNQASGAGSHGTTGSKTATTTLGAINVIIESLLSTYKHLSLYFATEYPIYHGDVRDTAHYGDNCQVNGMTQKQQHAAIQNEIELNHIPVCDLYNTLGWNEYNFSQYFRSTDSTHAFKGFKQVAERIAAFITSHKNF